MNKEDLLGGIVGIALLVAGFFVWLFGLFWLRIVTFLWLWAWFITPFGVGLLNFWHAAGLTLVVTFFTLRLASSSELKDNKGKMKVFGTPYMASLVLLGLGYLFQLGM